MKQSTLKTSLSSFLLVFSSAALAQPAILGDDVLHQVTAGTAGGHHSPQATIEGSGGAIVGNGSSATIASSGVVIVEGEAQSNAHALNIVNSSESTVANGVNIWDGQIEGAGNFNAGHGSSNYVVNQLNQVQQEQRRSAAVPEYIRPEANTYEEYDRSGSSTTSASINQSDMVTDVVTSESAMTTTSSGAVDTNIDIKSGDNQATVKGGKGVAIAGTVEATFDAGEIELGVAVNSGVQANGSGAGMTVGTGADTDVSVYGRLELPEFTVDIKGAGCGVMMGSCNSSGATTESSQALNDQSTSFQLATANSEASDYDEVGSTEYRSAFSLNNAQAEYIVVDDSEISVASEFSLSVSGAAQAEARGINVVNSSGSAVANGVNISRTNTGDLIAQTGNIITLNQTNIISHSR